MKQKKESLASKALNLMNRYPNMSPKDMAEKLGVKVQRVYVLRSNMKKKAIKTVKGLNLVSNVTTKRQRMKTTATVEQPSRYITELQEENKRLHAWCLEWREKYDKLQKDYGDAKVMFLNSQAVVDYLENKVANLITINNLKGN